METLVVKYGSDTVTNNSGADGHKIATYVNQIANIRELFNVVVVTSGATRTGELYSDKITGNINKPNVRSLAMLGSVVMHGLWQAEFAKQNIPAGMLLVTYRDIRNSTLASVLRGSLTEGIVPVINENDALNSKKMAVRTYGGDNDGLAAQVGVMLGASAVMLLGERGGIIADNGDEFVTVTPSQHEKVIELARSRSQGDVKCGLESKVEAAITASRAGVTVYIGRALGNMQGILYGSEGTCFTPVAR